ncbi:interferon-induced very large GTPase 1-like isoform X3 [Ambystoma mexicanum]|uniref:interferon-induced very large GTPase 1-like isoform X3 n=1 Tax=Ambystoma mexicanum TaxID=8296 RepID=UPI0037E76915
MASAQKPSEVIRRLRRKLTEILQSDSDVVLDELDSRLLITQEEYFKLSEISAPEKRVRAVLNTILQRGEETCQVFLEILKSLQSSFPGLIPLLEDSELGEIAGGKVQESQEEKKNDIEGEIAGGKVQESQEEKKNDIEGEKAGGKVQESQEEKKNDIEGEKAGGKVQESQEEKKNDIEGEIAGGKVQERQELKKNDIEAGGKVQESQEEKKNDIEGEIAGGKVQESQEEKKNDIEGEIAGGKVQESQEEKKNDIEGPAKAFEDILSLMNMGIYRTSNLSLKDVLEIGQESLTTTTTLKTLEDVPWHTLRNIMALNVTARNTSFKKSAMSDQLVSVQNKEESATEEMFCLNANDTLQSFNPLDVICVLFYCSDSFLRQELMLKMSMCQFALPLLLPPCDGTKCQFMLWAMRDIVRKWRPHTLRDSKGFREESLVLTPMPTISFVRLKHCSLSKSKMLNEVLSPPQQHHDFFTHRNMESGNVPRRISSGLVEISWYFPGGRENSDIFPEPVAVTNLRGDIEFHWLQFSFLSEISSALFIFVEHIGEREYALLSSLKESKTKFYFILNPQTDEPNETLGFLTKLAPGMKLDRSRLLVKGKTMNDAEFVRKLQSAMLATIIDPPYTGSVESMAATGRELGIHVDEDCKECQSASKCAKEITKEIHDVVVYKKEMMQLQGDLWKRLARIEKEFCRMRRQGDTHPEDYKSQLRKERSDLRKQQNKCDLTDGMIKFIAGIGQLSKVEKQYFLKWMKFNLDHIARKNLSKLRAEYKELCSTLKDDPTELAELDRKISESSLGLEHFMRELGQFYEAEYSMIRNGKLRGYVQFTHLPGIAADLLLEGFPLELIDGDASNIPLQWIADVLTELNIKLEGQSRIVVITVLGVQSTGKSTLLNTMFGLQFSVSSGRCTRGAFMLLMKVKDNLKEDLGCDFILVIDTEGLKAPELAKLEDTYEHDNELATLVIGLSDITIVNIAMENATEMKDILQIVVHAFLRMEEIGRTPNCQFVHQNVSDVCAYEQNMRDRKHLLEQLNEMTKVAAKMERQSREITFPDIMEYDPEKHNWYIPGLWHGVPPMAPVNRGYSENVHELKRYLFEFINKRSGSIDSNNILKLKKWIKSLWNAVKHENFIFSFRNSLVADAYNQVSMKYSEWEWVFCKEIYLWVSKAETIIQNQTSSELDSNTYNELKQEAFQKLQCEEQKMLTCVRKYFESGAQYLHMIEKYREDFIMSAKSLKYQLEHYLLSKFEEAIQIQKNKYTIESLQAKYMKVIEGKVVSLLEECRKLHCELSEEELEQEFGKMWMQTLTDLQLNRLEQRQVAHDMQCHLMKDLSSLGSFANQLLQNAEGLLTYGDIPFNIKPEYFDLPWYRFKGIKEMFTHECSHTASVLSKALINRCMSYVESRASSQVDYDGTFCKELLHTISECLKNDEFRSLYTTPHFEVDLKLHILGRAACLFQKMHEDFIKDKDPQCCLEKFRPQYFSTFKDLYLRKDECQKRAMDFCVQCLKPALEIYIEKRLGMEVVEDILLQESFKYSSRTFFQFDVLCNLLANNLFEGYKQYICNYEDFVKECIFKHILDHYSQSGSLQKLETKILSTITRRVREGLQAVRGQRCKTVSTFLEVFCRALQNDLVIAKSSLEVILFQNTANIEQFSDDIQFFLTDLEQSILTDCKESDIGAKLLHLPYKPQEELFRKVVGCGKQCPFCRAPCEAGGKEHKEHFASVHRPQGLGGTVDFHTKSLIYSLCSSDVVSNVSFSNRATQFQFHPYKDYRMYYPDWCIQPDASIEASDYWKFVFKRFNKQFAEMYNAVPAVLPSGWKKITAKQAQKSIQEVFNVKEK